MAKSESTDNLQKSIDKLETLSAELSINIEDKNADEPPKKKKLKLKASFAQQWKQGFIIAFKIWIFNLGIISFPALLLGAIFKILEVNFQSPWQPIIILTLSLLFMIGIPILAYRVGYLVKDEVRIAFHFKHESQSNSEEDECPTAKK